MKQFFGNLILLGALLVASIPAFARNVDAVMAKKAAENYLRLNELPFAQLQLNYQQVSAEGEAVFFVFNIDTNGFIIITGATELEPVLGYSFKGNFDTACISPSFKGWLQGYALAIEKFQQRDGAKVYTQHPEWTALMDADANYFASSTKNVNQLLTSEWDQGWGYNQYTPVGADGQHVVVGCVATAMAQIIRYYGYPAVGFGTSSYPHRTYGRQVAVHDTSFYDFANMPDRISYYSSTAEQRHAVSLLGYHCGVSVNMDYQDNVMTSGSGAHVNDVPAALLHFGYVNSYYLDKGGHSDQEWYELVRGELDAARPLLYRGISSSGGGHAFVCDGYRTSGNKFHFNWGWSGYQDGYYTMTDMNGYAGAQGAVFNFTPSYVGSGFDTIYVAADGTGDGSSWDNATPHLSAAIQLRGLYKSGHVWVKEGRYVGDTLSTAAFILNPGIRVYGSFAGTETAPSQRDIEHHPTILDGQGAREIFTTTTINKATFLNGITFENGLSITNQAAIRCTENMTLQNCTFRNNTGVSGNPIVKALDGTLKQCVFENNEADNILQINQGVEVSLIRMENNTSNAVLFIDGGGNIKSSLIAHNNGVGIRATNGGVLNCSVVSNSGAGILTNGRLTIKNTVVWNNDSSIVCTTNSGEAFLDTANVSFSAIEGDEVYPGDGNIALESANQPILGQAPCFTQNGGTRGVVANCDDSFRLLAISPLRNAGDTIKTGLTTYDLSGAARVREGRVDIGCYEFYPSASIQDVAADMELSVYPNPTTDFISVQLQDEGVSEIVVLDIKGRIVIQQSLQSKQARIDVRSLPQGVYVLRCGNRIAKFLIAR